MWRSITLLLHGRHAETVSTLRTASTASYTCYGNRVSCCKNKCRSGTSDLITLCSFKLVVCEVIFFFFFFFCEDTKHCKCSFGRATKWSLLARWSSFWGGHKVKFCYANISSHRYSSHRYTDIPRWIYSEIWELGTPKGTVKNCPEFWGGLISQVHFYLLNKARDWSSCP